MTDLSRTETSANDEDVVTLSVAKLAAILASADGFCTVCAGELADAVRELDPSRDWPALVRRAGGDA